MLCPLRCKVTQHKKKRSGRSCGVCGHVLATKDASMKAHHRHPSRGKVVCTVPAAMHVSQEDRADARKRRRNGDPNAHACTECVMECSHGFGI